MVNVERRGEAVTIRCEESDAALRELLTRYPQARDIEVRGAGLEDAFLELTGDHAGPSEWVPGSESDGTNR